jgi:hypothetical protein
LSGNAPFVARDTDHIEPRDSFGDPLGPEEIA